MEAVMTLALRGRARSETAIRAVTVRERFPRSRNNRFLTGAALKRVVTHTLIWFRRRLPDLHRRELLIGGSALVLSALAILITPHRITHYGYVILTMGLTELGRTS